MFVFIALCPLDLSVEVMEITLGGRGIERDREAKRGGVWLRGAGRRPQSRQRDTKEIAKIAAELPKLAIRPGYPLIRAQ